MMLVYSISPQYTRQQALGIMSIVGLLAKKYWNNEYCVYLIDINFECFAEYWRCMRGVSWGPMILI